MLSSVSLGLLSARLQKQACWEGSGADFSSKSHSPALSSGTSAMPGSSSVQ